MIERHDFSNEMDPVEPTSGRLSLRWTLAVVVAAEVVVTLIAKAAGIPDPDAEIVGLTAALAVAAGATAGSYDISET